MAREITQTSFFDHSPYSNVYYAAQIPIEYFLADVLLRHDVSRVVWASDAYAFRRRFELADQQGGEFDNIAPSNLNFPFINYWYAEGFWKPDDRPYVGNPQQILRGLWWEGLPSFMRSMAVKSTFSAIAYYSRDDDARLAYELLMWEYMPKGPIQLATTVQWKNQDIQVPAFLTLESIDFNPQFTEVDWLKTNRVVPIKFTFSMRTYILSYPKQPLATGATSSDEYPAFTRPLIFAAQEDVPLTISEHVLLEFAAAKQWGDLPVDTPDAILNIDMENPPIEYTPQEEATTEAIPENTTADIISGYFQTADLAIKTCTISDITTTGFKISWELLAEELEKLNKITIKVPGQRLKTISDINNITSYTVANLSPNSEYGIIVLFYAISGTIKDFHLTATTLSDAANPVGTPISKKRGNLKGMTF